MIDLPEESVGSDCVLCEIDGKRATARLLDGDVGPVCCQCFGELLNVEARLRWQAAMEGRLCVKP